MVLIFRFFSRLLAWLPAPLARGFGYGLAFWIGRVFRYRRAEIRQTLIRCFPEKSSREILQILNGMYRHMGLNLVDILRMPCLSDERLARDIYFVNNAYMQDAMAQGRGVVALTAHLGNWEAMAARSPASGYPLSIIVKKVKPPQMDAYLKSIRERWGTGVIHRRGGSREALRVLRRKEIVGFILDQNARAAEGVFVDFFDRPACTTNGLAQLAALGQCPIVPVFSIRLPDGRIEIKFLPPLDPPSDRSPESLAACTQACTRVIEEQIREHPDQWIWMHRRWRTQPPQ